MKQISFPNFTLSNAHPLVLIAGPCQLESLDHALMIGTKMQEICKKMGIGYIFKASFDKANRSALSGIRGPGVETGLDILAEVKAQLGLPVLTDIHTPEQCQAAARVVDVIQIPAFLCRQTDLLLAAGKSGAIVNVKKGQFLAPWDMANVAQKIASTGNDKIILTERGTSFGYNTLISDMRSLPQMAATGYPVIMDATHSVQQPGGLGTSSGGQREFAPVLARAAVAQAIAGVFIETHQDPDNAPSDGPNMIPLNKMEAFICDLVEFDTIAKKRPITL